MTRTGSMSCVAFAFGLAFAAPLFGAVLSAPPQSGKPVLVVHWPWQDAVASVHASGGYVLGPVRAPFGFLATSEDTEFPTLLAEMATVIVADGHRLAKLCGVI